MSEIELLQGTLNMLILKALAGGPKHGYAVAERIKSASQEVLSVEEGSLYPALHRMEVQGWIRSEWGQSENNRRARFYQLTDAGRRQLETETAYWQQLSAAIGLIMKATPAFPADYETTWVD